MIEDTVITELKEELSKLREENQELRDYQAIAHKLARESRISIRKGIKELQSLILVLGASGLIISGAPKEVRDSIISQYGREIIGSVLLLGGGYHMTQAKSESTKEEVDEL